MGWILTGLANVLLEVVNDLIVWLMSLYSDFEIDIGYDTKSSQNTLFLMSYFKGNSKGLFDTVLPDAQNFFTAFIFAGVFLSVSIMIFKMYQAMLGPLAEGEDPLAVLGKTAISVFCTIFSYDIFIFLEKIANMMYLEFRLVLTGIQDSYGEDRNNVFDAFSLTNNDELFKDQSDMNFGEDLTMIIVVLVLFLALLWQFIKLTMEMYERYVIIGVLFYTCPLAFSTLASKKTSQVFSNWCQMVASQFILMILNMFFIGVFTGAMSNMFDGASDQGYVFENGQDMVKNMLVLIALLLCGQKADEHLRSLGMSAAMTGGGLGAAVVGAYTAARQGTRMATSTGKKTKDLAKKSIEAVKEASARRAATNAAGLSTSPANIVANAERMNGKLTEDGAGKILHTPGASVKGADANDAMRAIGINPDDEIFNTIQAENGNLHNRFLGADWNNSEFGNGKATIRNQSGDTLGEFGLSDQYRVPDGGASKNLMTSQGMMTYAATSDIVSADANGVLDSINKSSAKYGIDSSVTWSNNGDGTLTGFYNGSPAYQAAPDYIAKVDPSRGPLFTGKTGDVSYTVQKINGDHASIGFASVKPTASSASLERYQKKSDKGSFKSAGAYSKYKKNR